MGNFERINRRDKIHWQKLAAVEQEHFKSAWVKSDTNVSLKFDLHRARMGHGRPGRVETDRFARVHRTQTARRSSQAGRLCSSPKIQKQAAFGMSHSVNSVHSVKTFSTGS